MRTYPLRTFVRRVLVVRLGIATAIIAVAVAAVAYISQKARLEHEVADLGRRGVATLVVVSLPDPDPLSTIKTYCAKKFHRVSMLQHLDRRRRTEIDALNGYVARESRRLGLSAPYSEALTMLMKGREYVPTPHSEERVEAGS